MNIHEGSSVSKHNLKQHYFMKYYSVYTTSTEKLGNVPLSQASIYQF